MLLSEQSSASGRSVFIHFVFINISYYKKRKVEYGDERGGDKANTKIRLFNTYAYIAHVLLLLLTKKQRVTD